MVWVDPGRPGGILMTIRWGDVALCAASPVEQWHWRLGGAGNLWSVFPDELVTYPELLEKAGYEVGVTGKGWGPCRDGRP